ncbi:uncharacterized protein [Chelonus insularis]|uniref:uncharacterized protein n=1 Tax=Chelonus insularis TaxID=460826 RepID=UPI001588D238|nr:uncharacterized protein LOC118064849 [Chelonus insularis]
MRPIIFLLLTCCLIASSKAAEDDYEYEDEPAPAPVTPAAAKPASRLGSLLSARGRAPVGGRKSASPTSTTPKQVEPVVDEEGENGEEFVDENPDQEEPQTTTTEASKKLRTAGGVRPFRSNEDLLAALKRRRAQVGSFTKEHTTHSPSESTTSKSKTLGGRSKSTTTNDSSVKSATRGRFGGNSRGKVQEEVEESQQDEIQVKAKPFRRG